MEKKCGGMNIRLKPETFLFFKQMSEMYGVGAAKLMADVLEQHYKQNILKKGENNARPIQEVPERPV